MTTNKGTHMDEPGKKRLLLRVGKGAGQTAPSGDLDLPADYKLRIYRLHTPVDSDSNGDYIHYSRATGYGGTPVYRHRGEHDWFMFKTLWRNTGETYWCVHPIRMFKEYSYSELLVLRSIRSDAMLPPVGDWDNRETYVTLEPLGGRLVVTLLDRDTRQPLDARWTANDKTYDSGKAAILPPGEHTLTFLELDGYVAPSPKTVLIESGRSRAAVAYYRAAQ